VTEVPKPVDIALDLLLYAPVGLAVTAVEELPKLAAKGRTRVDTQFRMARVVGRFAVARGRQQLEQRLSTAAPGRAEPSGRAFPSDEMTGNGSGSAGTRTAPRVSTAGDRARPPAAPAPRPEQLAIPGYDSLSASQVVQRLAGLSQEELAAVGAYERVHRGRRTILNRIDQLQPQGR
jgi:hypothetical protein